MRLFENKIKQEKRIEALFIRYQQRMLGAAYQILHDRQLAEDVFQDSMSTIWEIIEELCFDNPFKLEAFIFRMVKNKALNLLKKRKRESLSADSEGWGEEDSETMASSSNSYEMELEDTVDGLLAGLSHADAELIRLKYLEDSSNAALAKRYQISEATLRKRLERAKKRLKKEADYWG